MFRNIEEFYAAADPYAGLFDVFAAKHELRGRAQADHICYKCGSKESFETMRAMFEPADASDYMHQSIISGRRIAYIRLDQGIYTSLGPILFLELSDQKPDGSQKEGFDHIEVYPVGRTYDEMVQEFAAAGEEVTQAIRPHHTTDDIRIEGGDFLFRCTQEPLIDKIIRDEMK